MTFSAKVKEELSRQYGVARHCQIAELTAIITMCGRIQIEEGNHYHLWVHTENFFVARKFFTFLKMAFPVKSEVSIRKNGGSSGRTSLYTVLVRDTSAAMKVLKAAKLLNENGDIREDMSLVSNLVVQNTCCKRAFLRGAFLAAGSISDPEKGYHYEIVAQTRKKAEQLKDLMCAFGLQARVTKRSAGKRIQYLAYLKEGESLVDILNVMEAHQALMELENLRILKEMRNFVNRQVNCETANINKTVAAASRQVEDILYIRNHMGLASLPENLAEIAQLRLEHPEASLVELGSMLSSAIGKSGVNHRLKKLSLIADELKEKEEITC